MNEETMADVLQVLKDICGCLAAITVLFVVTLAWNIF